MISYAVSHWLPGPLDPTTGQRLPPMPCPDILTSDEAARYLRIDETATNNLKRSLESLRHREGIRVVKIGNRNFFPRSELDRFIKEKLQERGR